MKTVAIVQARMGSTRLPGKMLLPLAGAPLIQRLLERVRRATSLDIVVLAYPLADHAAFKPLLNAFVNTPGVKLGSWAFQGDENDLIARHLRAADAYGAELIVRIPGDNPCVDPAVIDQAMAYYQRHPLVWYSNTMGQISTQWFDGLGCEISSLSRWHWLDARTAGHPSRREHPHLLFSDIFRETMIESIQIEGFFHANEAIRLDVNIQEDYDRIAKLYETLYPRNAQFTASDIAAYYQEVPHEIVREFQPSRNSLERT